MLSSLHMQLIANACSWLKKVILFVLLFFQGGVGGRGAARRERGGECQVNESMNPLIHSPECREEERHSRHGVTGGGGVPYRMQQRPVWGEGNILVVLQRRHEEQIPVDGPGETGEGEGIQRVVVIWKREGSEWSEKFSDHTLHPRWEKSEPPKRV